MLLSGNVTFPKGEWQKCDTNVVKTAWIQFNQHDLNTTILIYCSVYLSMITAIAPILNPAILNP